MRRLRINHFFLLVAHLLLFLVVEGCATYLGARVGGAFDEASASVEPIPLDSLSHYLYRGDQVLVQTTDHGAVRGYVDMIRQKEFIVVCSDMKDEPEWMDQIEWNTIESVQRLKNHHIGETVGVFTGFAADLYLVLTIGSALLFLLVFGIPSSG
ncbi:hypothetical protein KQI63_04560 [bacterium]|nr:hypothetical protein [bacterium]